VFSDCTLLLGYLYHRITEFSERPATHDWRRVIIVARRSGAGYISCRWKGREEAIAVFKERFVVMVSVALNIGGLDGADKGNEF